MNCVCEPFAPVRCGCFLFFRNCYILFPDVRFSMRQDGAIITAVRKERVHDASDAQVAGDRGGDCAGLRGGGRSGMIAFAAAILIFRTARPAGRCCCISSSMWRSWRQGRICSPCLTTTTVLKRFGTVTITYASQRMQRHTYLTRPQNLAFPEDTGGSLMYRLRYTSTRPIHGSRLPRRCMFNFPLQMNNSTPLSYVLELKMSPKFPTPLCAK